MLLSLCFGKRGQNFHLLDLNFKVRKGTCVHFDMTVLFKNYGKAADVNYKQ